MERFQKKLDEINRITKECEKMQEYVKGMEGYIELEKKTNNEPAYHSILKEKPVVLPPSEPCVLIVPPGFFEELEMHFQM